MARLWSSGFELNSTTANMEWSAFTNGAASIVTTPVRSGTYALRYTGFTSSVIHRADFNFQSADANGPFYARVYLRFATYPTQNPNIITFAGAGGFTNERVSVRASSTGTLTLMVNSSTVVGSASSALSLNTWYRVEIMMNNTGGAGAGQAELRIDGVTVASTTTATIAGADFFSLGRSGVASTVGDYYFDDVAINNSTGSDQNSWPGDGSIVHLRPNAAGDNNAWATPGPVAGTTNNYQNVDEVTPDDATTLLEAPGVLNALDFYNIDNTPAAIGSTDTIKLVQIGVRGRAEAAGNGDGLAAIFKLSGGSVQQGSTVTFNGTTFKNHANAVPFNYGLTVYNPGSKSDLDTAQIGVKEVDTAGAVASNVTAVWCLVEYTPAATTTTSRLTLLGVG